MGGDINVESRFGEGSCFTLRVPLQLADPGTSRDSIAAGPAVLVLDPNPLNCAILKAVLAPRLGEIASARSLAEAMHEWASSHPELVLADVGALGPEEGLPEAMAHLASCWPEAQVTAARDRQLPACPSPWRIVESTFC